MLNCIFEPIKNNPFFIWNLRNIWYKHPNYWFKICSILKNDEIVEYINVRQYLIYEILTRYFADDYSQLSNNEVGLIVKILKKLKPLTPRKVWSGFWPNRQLDIFDSTFDKFFGIHELGRYSLPPGYSENIGDPFDKWLDIQNFLKFLSPYCMKSSDLFLWDTKTKKIIINPQSPIWKNKNSLYKWYQDEIDLYMGDEFAETN